MKTLEYYFVRKGNIDHVIFIKYTIDENGVIRNKNTGKVIEYSKLGKYNKCTVRDIYEKTYNIYIGRAIASTFHGPPLTLQHTADHIDRNPDNDMVDNIRWLSKYGQNNNRTMSETLKTAFIIIKDGYEKTAKEWVEFLKDQKNPFGRDYNIQMVRDYAQKRQHGFTYKEYPDLPGEVWEEIIGSKTKQGHWNISDMCRVKYTTKYAENVLSGERLGMRSVYPSIKIKGIDWYCHILAFKTFFPKEYDAKKSNEMVLHGDDNKNNFRPHNLRLGSGSANRIDAHTNGCYDGTKTSRRKCASYINGVLEKEYASQSDAVIYLKMIGFDKASHGNIRNAIKAFRDTKVILNRYERTWKDV
jgi:hypothetical protein